MMSMVQVLQDPVRNLKSMSTMVSGGERSKYFKRPIVPLIQEVIPQVSTQQMLPVQQNSARMEQQFEEQIDEPLTKTIGTQTLYRESETQTDPYTPDYRIRQGDNPEVLTIANLTWGNGLPATHDELEAIALAREKKYFEYSLPPTSDEASFHLRKRLMEAQEVRDWEKRENEIKSEQQERMNLLQSALKEREKIVEEDNARRIDDVKVKKTEQKNKLVTKIRRKKIKILRKLMNKRKNEEHPDHNRDIIEEYHNFASRVYAGIAREGLSIDKLSNKYEVQPISLTTYQGINDLVTTMNPKHLEFKVNINNIILGIQKKYTRMELAHKQALTHAETHIIKGKEKKEEQLKEEKKLLAKNMDVRPETPEKSQHFQHEKGYVRRVELFRDYDKEDQAILLLQKLIRGRAIQNAMYEGKEKRLALIEELLIVAQVKPLEQNEVEELLLQQHEERLKDAVLESIQGEIMSRQLDMLSKELIRFKQQKKINAMVNIAENDRRKREAEERGRRQAEKLLEHREDLMYGEIYKVHQGTVDTFLDQMFNTAVDHASSRRAYLTANLKKDKIDNQIENLENKHSRPNAIIKDLLTSFLVPNVHRRKLQKRIQVEQRRFQVTAKNNLAVSLKRACQDQERLRREQEARKVEENPPSI